MYTSFAAIFGSNASSVASSIYVLARHTAPHIANGLCQVCSASGSSRRQAPAPRAKHREASRLVIRAGTEDQSRIRVVGTVVSGGLESRHRLLDSGGLESRFVLGTVVASDTVVWHCGGYRTDRCAGGGRTGRVELSRSTSSQLCNMSEGGAHESPIQ